MNITTEMLESAGCKTYGLTACDLNGKLIAFQNELDGPWVMKRFNYKPRFRVKAISLKQEGNQ